MSHTHQWGSWSAWEPIQGVSRPLEVRDRYCQTCGKHQRETRYR